MSRSPGVRVLLTEKTAPRRAVRRIWLTLMVVALLCSLVALVSGTALFVRQVDTMLLHVEEETALSAKLRDLQGVALALGDAETGQRGYLLAGKERYLEPYRRALAVMPGLLQALGDARLSDPVQRARIDRARHLVGLKLAELTETIRLHDEGQREAALAVVVSDAGQAYMEQARAEIGAVLESVRGERARLNREIGEGVQRSERLLISTVSLFLAFIVLASTLLIVSLRARNRTERALARSEQRHRAIVEEQAELVSQSRGDGMLVYVNPAYARYFGRQPHEMVGTSLFDHVEPHDRDFVRLHLAEVMQSGEVKESENRMLLPGGGERWVAWTNRRQRDAEGGYLLHSVGRDFTERRQVEQRLAESERFVRQVTDNVPVRISYADREMRYRFVNQLHCQRFGRPRSEVLGRTRDELTQGAMDEAVRVRVDAAFAGERQRFEFEEVIDGQARRIESQLIPDLDENGQVRGIYTTGMDITERTAAERAQRELTAIVEHTPDFVMQTDARGAVQYMNPAVRRVLGLALDAPVQGFNFQDFNTPETSEKFARVVMPEVLAGGVWSGEATVYVENRRVVPVSHMVIAHRGRDGRVERFSAVMRDISAEVQARYKLLQQTATLQSVTEAIPAMVAVLGADRCYRFVNHALERWLGRSREALIGRTLEEVLGSVEYEGSKPWVDKVLAGETVNFQKDLADRHPPVHLVVHYIPVRLDSGEIDGFISVSQDVTQHHQETVRLLQLVERDALTGLLNRAGFEKCMARAVQAGEASSLALLYIDLDHFKPVNDRHGHPVGDQLLRQFAQRMRALVRPTDAVARLGGDEFAVVLSGVREHANAAGVADKILEAAHLPFEVGELRLQIGASIGLAYDASDAAGLEGLVARADGMLYQAKAAGRGRRA